MSNQPKSQNIVWHHGAVTRDMREEQYKQKSCTLWFTGLSGSGKSTLAHLVQHRLFELGKPSYVLDGDNLRHGLNVDLGFSPADRNENIRRSGEVAKLFNDAGLIVLTAFISPYRADRDKVRNIMNEGQFIEVWLNPSLDVCEARDPKGLYKKARAGQIPEFTGISAPYEEPLNAEIPLDTGKYSQEEAAQQILDYLNQKGYLL
ncbi:MAG: adenylyl-sulfate kinase [SAR324 cluster bacterium]|nr:adenylyl-sulfate kinase [SAR324 cluster bacterium]